MNNRIKQDELKSKAIRIINNSDLDCNDCKYRLSVTGYCLRYDDIKPIDVLNGGKCERKRARNG